MVLTRRGYGQDSAQSCSLSGTFLTPLSGSDLNKTFPSVLCHMWCIIDCQFTIAKLLSFPSRECLYLIEVSFDIRDRFKGLNGARD